MKKVSTTLKKGILKVDSKPENVSVFIKDFDVENENPDELSKEKESLQLYASHFYKATKNKPLKTVVLTLYKGVVDVEEKPEDIEIEINDYDAYEFVKFHL